MMKMPRIHTHETYYLLTLIHILNIELRHGMKRCRQPLFYDYTMIIYTYFYKMIYAYVICKMMTKYDA